MTHPTIDHLVSASPVVMQSPVSGLEQLQRLLPSSVTMMYGETFDDVGLPVDALKYYSWLSIVSAALVRTRAVTSDVVVADFAVTVNKGREWGAQKISLLADRQIDIVNAFAGLCADSVKPRPVLMSEITRSESFRHRRSVASGLLQTNSKFHDAVVGSVRADHVESERTSGFQYSLDEVALIAAYNVKVGPPREQFYDRAARELNASEGDRQLHSILLTPTFPLALSPGEFVRNRELREFGVTAYKATSLGYARNRLVIGRDGAARAKELIERTKLVRRPGAPNSVTELARVLQMVQWAINGAPPENWLSEGWERQEVTDAELRQEVTNLYARYIDSLVAPALGSVYT